MTNDEFNIGLKILFRYLKENGRYSFIVKFLFPYDRPIPKLYRTLNYNRRIHFCNIFIYEESLGSNYQAMGNEAFNYWESNFQDLHYDWLKYCQNHKERRILCEI
jgi:hypothetical protein